MAGGSGPADPAALIEAHLARRRAERETAVAASAARLRERIDVFAAEFFGGVFAREPRLRGLFVDPDAERRKLGPMLSTLVPLDGAPSSVELLAALGARHVRYGVGVDDYPVVIDAFAQAVERVDPDASPDIVAAWRRLLLDAAAVLQKAAPTAPAMVSAAPAPAASPTALFDEVGGRDVIERVHRRFYASMTADHWLDGFFAGKSIESLIMKQTAFMTAAFGGPNEYVWQSPAAAHAHMMVTEEHADIREILLRNAIRAEGLSQDIEDRWLATDQAFRPAVVKRSDAELVMQQRGQLPVSVRKPAVYVRPRLTPRSAPDAEGAG